MSHFLKAKLSLFLSTLLILFWPSFNYPTDLQLYAPSFLPLQMCLQHLWCLFNVPRQSDHVFVHSGCSPSLSLFSPCVKRRTWTTADLHSLLDSFPTVLHQATPHHVHFSKYIIPIHWLSKRYHTFFYSINISDSEFFFPVKSIYPASIW